MNEIKKNTSPYKASLTQRQYLFHEMRTTTRIVAAGLSDEEIVQTILAENLFQYPTEKSVRDLARICIQRLRGFDDSALVESIANAYEEKIHHLDDQKISINLDDGVKHNSAIFQDVLAKIK